MIFRMSLALCLKPDEKTNGQRKTTVPVSTTAIRLVRAGCMVTPAGDGQTTVTHSQTVALLRFECVGRNHQFRRRDGQRRAAARSHVECREGSTVLELHTIGHATARAESS